MRIGTRIILAITVLASVLALSATSHAAGWPLLPGNRCWTMEGDPSFLFKLRILPMGGGYFQLAGKATMGGTLHNVFSGSAVSEGNALVAHLTDSGSGAAAMWASLATCTFDRRTLAGSCQSIGFDRNHADLSIDAEFTTSSLVPVRCP